MKADPTLATIIKRVGPCELHAVAPRDPFETLCMSIASQQLSTKAAATIFRRFCDLFPPDRRPTPERVMTLTDDEIRAVRLQPAQGDVHQGPGRRTCSTAGSICRD